MAGPNMDLSDHQISSILSRGYEETEVSDSDRENIQTFSRQLIAIAQLLRKEDFGAINDIIRGNRQLPSPNEKSPSSIARSPFDADGQPVISNSISNSRELYVEQARKTYALRRKRTGIFGTVEIFGEPAWDILLDLYIAEFENKPVCVSSACIGSSSPPTTGLRWLGVLSDQGFVERQHDPNDQRRILVRLTQRGVDCMDTYFATAAKDGGSA